MALASVDDVLRLLDEGGATLDAADTDAITKALQTAESWARLFMRDPNYGATGATTESHHYVREDSEVAASGVVTQVAVLNTPGGALQVLTTDQWTYDGQHVRLAPNLSILWDDATIAGDAVNTSRIPTTLVRVDVTTTLPGIVDPIVRDAVAMAAGALWTRAPRLVKGLTGERIGDYSYTVANLLQGDPFFEQAKSMLRPFRRRDALVI